MRREVIVRVVQKLLDDIKTTGIDVMFNEAIERNRPSNKAEETIISFDVFQKYSVATASYGEVERAIAKIVGLDPLFSAETWKRLVLSPDPPMLYDMRHRINFAKTDLPRIISLFKQESVAIVQDDGETLPRELRGKTAITFILPEEEHEYSSPARLISALEAIASLYSVFCTIENESESELIVLAIDSGSDKSFDFLGVAKLMEEIRKLVMSIWDRRVFYRHMHASQCIGLIAESLPVIERIEALKKSHALEPEQAELLKRKTLQGATQFLESGIYIDDMNVEGRQSPRQLMRPEPKLLVGPPTVTTPIVADVHVSAVSASHAADGHGVLSDDEVAQLKRLLAKAEGNGADTSESAKAKPAAKRRKSTPD